MAHFQYNSGDEDGYHLVVQTPFVLRKRVTWFVCGIVVVVNIWVGFLGFVGRDTRDRGNHRERVSTGVVGIGNQLGGVDKWSGT